MLSHAYNVIGLLVRDDSVPASQLPPDQRQVGCVAWDPAVDSAFHYVPSLPAGLIFSIVFGLSMFVHIWQSAYKRKWWYMAFALGSLGECMGWGARTAAHFCPYNNTAFMIQIAVLILAPCFYSAALYYILAELIRRWGREYSKLSPQLYLWIFISFDILSIALQGAGGGIAASAFGTDPPGDPSTGTHIMLAGIGLQLGAMCIFSLLLAYTLYAARGAWVGRGRKTSLLLGTVVVGDCLILARNFYRAVELGEGWTSTLMTTEVYQCVLDAALMAIFTLAFNIVHPAWFMGADDGSSGRAPVKRVSDSSDEEMAFRARA